MMGISAVHILILLALVVGIGVVFSKALGFKQFCGLAIGFVALAFIVQDLFGNAAASAFAEHGFTLNY